MRSLKRLVPLASIVVLGLALFGTIDMRGDVAPGTHNSGSNVKFASAAAQCLAFGQPMSVPIYPQADWGTFTIGMYLCDKNQPGESAEAIFSYAPLQHVGKPHLTLQAQCVLVDMTATRSLGHNVQADGCTGGVLSDQAASYTAQVNPASSPTTTGTAFSDCWRAYLQIATANVGCNNYGTRACTTPTVSPDPSVTCAQRA